MLGLKQKGAVSIILTLLVLATLLVIVLGVSVISLNRLKITAQMGQSVTAYYAAEAGIERCLYEIWNQGNVSCDYSDVVLSSVDAKYTVSGTLDGGEIESSGWYGITSRKIKTEW